MWLMRYHIGTVTSTLICHFTDSLPECMQLHCSAKRLDEPLKIRVECFGGKESKRVCLNYDITPKELESKKLVFTDDFTLKEVNDNNEDGIVYL